MAERRRSIFWRLRRLGYVALVLAVVAVGGLWMALNTIDLPPAKRSAETTFVCDIGVGDGQCDFGNSMAHLSAERFAGGRSIVLSAIQRPPTATTASTSAT